MVKRTFLYHVAKVVCPIIYGIYSPMKLLKKTELPAGRVIVCSNHLSIPDPIYLGMVHRRQIYYMAKAELFRNKFLAAVIRGLGGFPVVRGAGDEEALNRARDLLQHDQPVGIFLEGTRSKTGELLRPKTGAAMLAYANNAPILPMCITGPNGGKIKPFHKIYVSCGELMTPQELGMTTGSGMEFRHASRIVMDKIAEMRQEHLLCMEKEKLRLGTVK